MQSKTSMLAWHYTGYSAYEKIKASNRLIPKPVSPYSSQSPVLWYTTSQHIDPVVAANLRGLDNLRPLVRIGQALTANFLPFEKACATANVSKDTRRRLVKKAEKHGANTMDWYGVVRDRAVQPPMLVEFFDRQREVWVSTRPDLIIFPEKLHSVHASSWASSMGLLCERDFLREAVSGSMGYTMQEYANGYVTGDEAFYSWSYKSQPDHCGASLKGAVFLQGFLDRVAHLTGLYLPEEYLAELLPVVRT